MFPAKTAKIERRKKRNVQRNNTSLEKWVLSNKMNILFSKAESRTLEITAGP
jgi:hypothetical protein